MESEFMKVLNSLWQAGLYKTISLPAIVVCGDQSSGKSSVLEAMSGFRFPIDDGMCTRFETRVEMDRDKEVNLQATIEPSAERTSEERKMLERWKHETKDLSEFGKLVTLAGEAMGSAHNKGFMKDLLVIQVSSPNLSAFTFVDLPGLIHSTREGQPDDDVEHIKNVVKRYMADKSKIILTVVAADIDLEVQGVLQYAKQLDPTGERTMGVITKPDTCGVRPKLQKAVFDLLQNVGASRFLWRLGWHVLKNRSDRQRDMTTEQRDQAEAEFLEQDPWRTLPKECRGAERLSQRLEYCIYEAFIKMLPDLIKTVSSKILDVGTKINDLSPKIPTTASLRANLQRSLNHIQTAMRTQVSKVNHGSRHSFGNDLAELEEKFLSVLYSSGHHYHFDQGCLSKKPLQPTKPAKPENEANWELSEPRPVQDLHIAAERIVTDSGLNAGQISDKMHIELFRQQVAHWPELLLQYIDKITEMLIACMEDSCSPVVPELTMDKFNEVVVVGQAEIFADRLRRKVDDAVKPVTLSHTQATEAAARAWKTQHSESELERLRRAFGLENATSTTSTPQNPRKDYNTVLSKLRDLDVNVDRFAARQTIALMQSLYIERTEDLKHSWKWKTMLFEMEDFFNGFPQRVMEEVKDEDLIEMYVKDEDLIGIYGGLRQESEKMLELKEQRRLYKESLDLLEGLKAKVS